MNGFSSRNDKAKIAESYNLLYSQFSSDQIKEIGNYTIIKPIGEGAFGKVYLANHKLTHTKVVLKTGSKDDPNLVREVYYHRQFKHPNITRLYEVILSEGMIWMVLEYCPGKELYDQVLSSGRIPLDESRKLFAQIVSSVFYAHSLNCIHRDLKLENILLDKNKNAKLSDFGFTREYEQRSILETICGTTVYMAPELIEKKKYDGFKVDIWSLGVILYTILYGQMPFDEDDDIKTQYQIVNSEPPYRDDIPQDAIALIKNLLNKNPSKRFTAQEILDSSFLDGYGLRELEVSNSLLKGLSSQRYFHSKTEKHLLKKLKSIGIDVHSLQKSVVSKKCDSLAGLWELLLEKQKKKELKMYKTRSRSVLRITDSTSKRVSQFMDPLSTPQTLSRIVSRVTNQDQNNELNSINQSINQSPRNNGSIISSPEKKKNGFIQKFTKLWKINKKEEPNSITNSDSSSNIIEKSSHLNDRNNIQHNTNQHLQIHNNQLQHHQKPSIRINLPKVNSQKEKQSQLTIQEPRSPTRSTNGSIRRSNRPRPVSLISQQSLLSQFTTSDVSLLSDNTMQSDNTRPLPKKVSSDTSIHSRNTTRRSLSLISSNSSTSDRSSRKSSFYDQSTSASEIRITQISRNNRRGYNESAIFPKSLRRRKSPLGYKPSKSKFKRSKTLIIEEEEDDDDREDLEDLETDVEHLGIAESTRRSSDFEDELSVSERGRRRD